MKSETNTNRKQSLQVSRHARRRQQQRGLSIAQIEATLTWGRSYRQGRGREAFFLGEKDAAFAAQQGEDITNFVGTTVIVGGDGLVITVYRNQCSERIRKGSK